MDFASSHQFLSATYVHPIRWPASALLAGFKVFFSLVLLQQLFASVRRQGAFRDHCGVLESA